MKAVGLILGMPGCEPENCKEKVWLWSIRSLHFMLFLLWTVDLWDHAATMSGSVLWNRSLVGVLHLNAVFNSVYFNMEANILLLKDLVQELSKIVRKFERSPRRTSIYRHVSIVALGLFFLTFSVRLIETFYVAEFRSVAVGTQHIVAGLLLFGSLYYTTLFMGVVFYQLNLITTRVTARAKEKPMQSMRQHEMVGRLLNDHVNAIFGLPILLMNVTLVFLTLDLLFTLNSQVSNAMWLSTYLHSLSGIFLMMVTVEMACRMSKSSAVLPDLIYDQILTRRMTSRSSIYLGDLFLANFRRFSVRVWNDIALDRKLILIFTGVIGFYAVIRAQRVPNSVPLYMLTNYDSGEMAFVKNDPHHHHGLHSGAQLFGHPLHANNGIHHLF
ncbi:hypothetical protein BIW11_01788 [Tropilaelaps mercedesae]|uniref:Uncharacterized protein n=1 Tax=Tropilaelaps mercedesae TaxID=418985 RepID=A0A1V9X8A9_9ACAR|nr:hypothetical protein BIW11_01788 [Tropilaelaps mercedesae]